MIGNYALRGFVNPNDRYCCGADTRGMISRGGALRISAWLNLLKKMEFKTTTDVVAVYLIATRQSSLIDPIMSYCISNHDEYFRSGTAFCSNVFASGGCTKLFEYEENDVNKNSGQVTARSALFPPELFKMARDYQLTRIANFIDVIVDLCDSGYSVLHSGSLLPARVVNALNTFSNTATSVNNIASSLKSLHATIFPDAMWDDYTLHGSGRYPSLKWDATSSFMSDKKDWVHISACDCKRIKTVSSLTRTMAGMLRAVLTKDGVSEMPVIELRDAFCSGCEILLHVVRLATEGYAQNALPINMPKITEANKFFFANRVRNDGSADHDCRSLHCEAADSRNAALALRHLSPEAAICVGGRLMSGNSSTEIYAYRSEEFEKFIEYLNPQPYGEVLTFLMNEQAFQDNQRMYIRYAQEKLKKGEVA